MPKVFARNGTGVSNVRDGSTGLYHRRFNRPGNPPKNARGGEYEYQYDDGTDEEGWGMAEVGAALAWLQRYDAQPGAETIGYVATGVGGEFHGDGLVGETLSVYVWDDPNDDGDPSDLVYLGGGTGVVTIEHGAIMNVVALDGPITVSGQFYIGASLVQTLPPPLQTLAPVDTSQASNGRAWMAVAFDGNYDPNNPGGDFGLEELDDIGYPGVWLIRARVAQVCQADGDCDDGNPCTVNTCVGGFCGTTGDCSVADFDRDGDVDLTDWEVMRQALTGPNP